MENEITKGFKAFNKGMKCRDMQYTENTEFTSKNAELCSTGLHFCKLPLDVLNYYPYNSEFAEVEGKNVLSEGDKCVTKSLLVKDKLNIFQMFKLHFEIVFKSVETSTNLQQTSGNYAHSQTSGNRAISQTSGNRAISQTSGNGAHSQTSGNYAHSQTSGNGAISQTSGNYAHSQTSGNGAISCSLGIQSKATALKGHIIIVDWQYKNAEWVINKIHTSKVGGKIKGVKIEPTKRYWFQDGELNSEDI
jgi:hypothetical protein